MKINETALILIGYQNDYFAKDGILHSVVSSGIEENQVLENSLKLIEKCIDQGMHIINIPIYFSDDYCELEEPVGLLSTIKEVGAFKESTQGGAVIDEILSFGDKITDIRGKTGFNAFSKTDLNEYLKQKGIQNTVFAGVVTSICIDSSARAAFELGYNTMVLSDCIAGRSKMENNFYCSDIFPLYSKVVTSKEFLEDIE
jgi:nicotinamidase-related amidase